MRSYSLFHLTDRALLRDLVTLVNRDRARTALLLAHVAETDDRRLYAPAGYPSMYAYCVGELRFSEQAALKRIRVARAARQFPAIFPALADGRLNLSAVILLLPHLTSGIAAALLAAAAGKSKAEIETLLAHRCPRPDVPARVEAIGLPPAFGQLSPGTVGTLEPGRVASPGESGAPAPARVAAAGQPAPAPVALAISAAASESILPPARHPRITPLAPERYALQVTISQSVSERLNYARALLRDQIPSAGLADVLAHGIEALIAQLEKRKFAATSNPKPQGKPARGRHIPAGIKRQVWTRDLGRCTFVAENDRRCDSCTFLEFDHIEPVALGGKTTLENLRLLCRAHNQYEAGQVFGAGFMHGIRERAKHAATSAAPRESPASAR